MGLQLLCLFPLEVFLETNKEADQKQLNKLTDVFLQCSDLKDLKKDLLKAGSTLLLDQVAT